MVHPFVPTLLLVWTLSMGLRACGVPEASLPLQPHGAHRRSPEAVKPKPPAPVPARAVATRDRG